MATVVNFIDTTLQSAPSRTTVYGPNVGGFLTRPVATLAADSSGTVASFALAGGTFNVVDAGTDVTGTAAVTYSVFAATGCTAAITSAGVYSVSAMSADTASATLRAVYGGVTTDRLLSLSKAKAGTNGATGPAGANGATGAAGSTGSTGAAAPLLGTARMYQWSTVTPSAPTGTSTITWATGVNSAYSGSDGWTVTAAANPGTPGVRLYVAENPVTAAAGTPTSSVSYSGANIAAWSQNGANGTPGANAFQSAIATVYQWAATIPAGPIGSATLTWSSSAFGAAPSGYTLTPGTGPLGYTLWAASVRVVDSALNATTPFNWSSASVMAIGYAGTNGSNGANGATGATGGAGAEGTSYVTAYCASATVATSTAPAATAGKTSLPATNSGGLIGAYSFTVPTLTSGQFMYQTDGIYNPATGQVTWSIPYWSSLKVATLSAITANLGAINAGSIDLGSGTTSWHVDAAGNTWAGASSYASAPYRVSNAGAAIFTNVTITNGASTIIDASGLKAGFEAPGTKNVELVPSISSAAQSANWATVTGTGKPEDGANFTSPSSGQSLNDDPMLENPNAWAIPSAVNRVPGTTAPGASGLYYFSSPGFNYGDHIAVSKNQFAIDPSHIYNLTANLFAEFGNDRSMYILVQFYDAGGKYVGSPVTGWGGTMSGYVYGGQPPTGRFTVQGGDFGVGTGRPIPAQVRTVEIGVWFQYSGGGGSNVDQGAQDIRLQDVTAIRAAQTAADAANAAINDPATGLAKRLRSNAQNILSGGAALTVGTLVTDGSGNRTSGYGIGLTQNGFVAYDASGAPTITINGATGAITAKADISGSTGTFGAVVVGVSLSCGQTAYDTGTGFWLGLSSGTPKFSIGAAGGASLKWNGSSLSINNATVSGATINSPTITSPVLDAFTATSPGYIYSYGYSASRIVSFPSAVAPAGGRSPFTYSWQLFGSDPISIRSGGQSSSPSFYCVGASGNDFFADALCTITDANGRTASVSGSIEIAFR